MGETKENDADEEELLDYEEDGEKAPDSVIAKVNGESVKNSRFRDFPKPELLRAIVDYGFEHPSEGGALMGKSPQESQNLIEQMAANNYQ